MDLNKYQLLGMRTAKVLPLNEALIHGALGLASEAGEFCTDIKAYVVYGKTLDKDNAKAELGDVLWFLQYTAATLGLTLEEVAQYNIDKLRKRYPDKYSDEAALARADDVGHGG